MLNKYFAFALISAKQSFTSRFALFGRICFLGLILFVFSHLWEITNAVEKSGFTRVEMIWYLMFTECIVISLPMIHLSIENDVKNGSLMYQLIRPVSYITTKVAEAFGDYLVRGLFIISSGFIYAFVFSKSFPLNVQQCFYYLALFCFAGLIGITAQVGIGIAAFWIFDSNPIHWLWQKMLFIFGGMILPLSIYPLWMQQLASWTPFPSMLSAPALVAIGHNKNLANIIMTQLLWLSLFLIVIHLFFKKAIAKMSITGG